MKFAAFEQSFLSLFSIRTPSIDACVLSLCLDDHSVEASVALLWTPLSAKTSLHRDVSPGI